MDLFIIKWEVIDKKDGNVTIIGFSSDLKCIRVIGFCPYIYSNSITEEKYRFLRGSTTTENIKQIRFNNSNDINNYKYKNYNKEIYEEDIPIMLKFLSSNQLNTVGWVRVEEFMRVEKNILTNLDEYIVKEKSLKNINNLKHDIPNIKILSFDIECYSKNRGMSDARNEDDKIFMISMLFFDNNNTYEDAFILSLKSVKKIRKSKEYNYKYYEYYEEFDLLEGFFKLIKEHDPSVITGYNIFGFDMKYIKDKYYSYLKNIPNGGRCRESILPDTIVSKNWRSSARGLMSFTIINFVGRCMVDVYQYIKTEIPLQKYSLDYVSEHFLGEKKIDMSYEKMFQMYEQGRLNEIADYCYKDSLLTKKLWLALNIWFTVIEGAKIFVVDIHDLYSKGQQSKIFNQLYYNGHNKKYIFNKIKNLEEDFNYSGAIVLDPEKGLHKNCCIVDFASLYPSIIISENICYTTQDQETKDFSKESKGLIPLILEYLISERKEIKKLIKLQKDKILMSIYEKKQLAYKVAANSFYGAFGSRDSEYLQLLEAAKLVTQIGRKHLLKAVGIINNHHVSCKVIYGDTDSCFFVGKNKPLTSDEIFEIINDINSRFHSPVKMSLEGVFDKIFFLAKKKYIFIRGKELKYKGVITAKRDSCLWAKMIYEEVIKRIMFEKDNKSVNKYLIIIMKEILSGNINDNFLYINRNLGNNYKLENYPLRIFSKILSICENRDVNPGERLEYYFVKSSHKYQGYRMASKKMIEKYNLQIDYKYYVTHQLKLPIVQLYDALCWKFSV
jgi:DNA polymerase delta subunit 1